MSWYDPTSWDVGDWTDVGAAVLTGGASLGFSAVKKGINSLLSPDMVNSRGDKLSDADKASLAGLTPEQAAVDMRNWLTAGGPPKPIDPSQIFLQDQILSPVLAKSAAGMGINGLFGVGKSIGDLQPLNLSPLKAGVPYSALPLPGWHGGGTGPLPGPGNTGPGDIKVPR